MRKYEQPFTEEVIVKLNRHLTAGSPGSSGTPGAGLNPGGNVDAGGVEAKEAQGGSGLWDD